MRFAIKNRAWLLLLGLIAGFASATLGIGGGVIIVPCLVLLFRYRTKRAIGTSLATIVPTTIVGITAHYIIESSNIKWIIAIFIALGSMVGAKYGAALANKLSGNLLKRMLALVLVFSGLKLADIIRIPTSTIATITGYPLLVVLGFIAGGSSALLGIGGGIIVVPILTMFFGLTIHQAIATSLVMMLPTSLVGAWSHHKYGNVKASSLRFLVPTALVGAVFGAVFANSLPVGTLKLIFGIFLLLVSVLLFFKKSG
jgi:uncharacterized membrane protein YfcA